MDGQGPRVITYGSVGTSPQGPSVRRAPGLPGPRIGGGGVANPSLVQPLLGTSKHMRPLSKAVHKACVTVWHSDRCKYLERAVGLLRPMRLPVQAREIEQAFTDAFGINGARRIDVLIQGLQGLEPSQKEALGMLLRKVAKYCNRLQALNALNRDIVDRVFHQAVSKPPCLPLASEFLSLGANPLGAYEKVDTLGLVLDTKGNQLIRQTGSVIRDRLHGEIRAAIEAGTVGPLGSRLYFCGVQDLDFLVQRLKHEIPAGVPDIVLGLAQRISLVCTRQERVLAPKSAKALVTLFLNQSTCNLPALSEVAVYFNGVPMLRFMKALSLKALDKFQVLFSTFGDGQKYYLVSSAIYDSDFELAGKALALPMDASFAVPNTESMINTSLLLGAITLQAPVNIIRGLLARGANPDDQISDGGSTVLEYVLEKGRDTQWVEEVTLCLLEYRARATPRLTYAEAMETMGAVPRGLMSAFAFEHKDPIQLARAKQCSTKTISAIEAALKREAEHQAARDKRAGATREAAIASGGGGNEGD